MLADSPLSHTSEIDKIVATAPFVAAILTYLIYPEFSKLLRRTVVGRIVEASSKFEGAAKPPPHLSAEHIGDYMEYAGDAAQVIPATFLAIVGTVSALIAGLPVLIAVALLVISLPLVFYLILKVLNTDPSKYLRRGGKQIEPRSASKFKNWFRERILRRYTLVTTTGILLNFIGTVLVVIFVK